MDVVARGTSFCIVSDLRRPVRRRMGVRMEAKKSMASESRPSNSSLTLHSPNLKKAQLELVEESMEEIEIVSSLLEEIRQIETSIAEGLEEEKARNSIRQITMVLEKSHLVENVDLVLVARMLGAVALKSPLKSMDSEFKPAIQRLTHEIQERMSTLGKSDFCNFIWVYGCFGPSILLPTMFEGTRSVISQMCMRIEGDAVESVRDVVCLFYGLQKMKFSPHNDVTYQTLRKLGPLLKLQRFNVNDLATLAVLAAKLKVSGGAQFLRQVGRTVKLRLSEFSDQALRDFVLAYVVYDYRLLPGLFDAFTNEVRSRISTMRTSYLIEIVLSMSRITYLPSEGFLNDFCHRLLNDDSKLGRKDVSNCCLALGQLSWSDPDLMALLKKRFYALKKYCDSFQICNVLLGFKRLNLLDVDLLKKCLTALSQQLEHGLRKPQRMVVHQALAHGRLFLQLETIPEEWLPVLWQEACRETWMHDQKRFLWKESGSILQTAELMGLKWEQDVSPVAGISVVYLYSAEFEKRIVIDLILQKHHTFMNKQNVLLSWKEWQNQVLRQEGFDVVTIFETRWTQVPEVSKLRHLGKMLGLWTMDELIEMEIQLGIREPIA